jgi:hypothetical protein
MRRLLALAALLAFALAAPAGAKGSPKPLIVTGGTITITFAPSSFGPGADTSFVVIAPGKQTAPDTFVFPLHGGKVYSAASKLAAESSLRATGGLTISGPAGNLTFKPVWGGTQGINDNKGNQLLDFNVPNPKVTKHGASFTASATPGTSYGPLFGSGAAFNTIATVIVAAKGHR